MSTLVDRLSEAAVSVIESERRSLEDDPRKLRGVTIELSLGSGGHVASATCYVERRHRLNGRAER